MKVNIVLACMRRGFINLNEYNYTVTFDYTSQWFDLRILEYGSIILKPHYVLDQCKLKGVQ